MTRRILSHAFVGALLLVGAGLASAATIYVPDDYSTIQAAIDAAIDGDEVVLRPGLRTSESNISFLGKAITVRSEDPDNREIVEFTGVLFGHPAFVFENGEGRNSVLAGLRIAEGGPGLWINGASPTITRCIINNNTAENGGGIYSVGGGSPRILECEFYQDRANQAGSVLYAVGGSPFLQRSIVRENYSGDGTVFLEGTTATLEECDFHFNDAGCGSSVFCRADQSSSTDCDFFNGQADNGGAVFLDAGSDPIFTRCLFIDNNASMNGEEVSSQQSSGTFRFCNFWNEDWMDMIELTNSSPRFVQCLFEEYDIATVFRLYDDSRPHVEFCTFYLTGGSAIRAVDSSNAIVRNSIVWGNIVAFEYDATSEPRVEYSDVLGGWPGVGNINAYPKFDSWEGLYKVLAPGSPCIDAGDPALKDGVDWDAIHPAYGRVNGTRSDMGAYGGPGNDGWLK